MVGVRWLSDRADGWSVGVTDENNAQGEFETRKDAGEGGPGVYKLWMRALDIAGEDEKNWRKHGTVAIERYQDATERKGARFNILYSSVQTQGPAIYNSTPKPDVRRRFGDEDPVGKIASQAFERALSHCIDEYDFDAVMDATVNDSLLPGRGVPLVVYDAVPGEDGVDYETVRTEHVQWDDFRRGPAKQWTDVPWIAIRYRITRDQAVKLNPKEGGTVTLDHTEGGEDKEQKDVPSIFKRLTVWKIWDKAKRQIVFIAPSFKEGPFAIEPDTLQLKDFYPVPRPLYDVIDSTTLVPQVPYDKYKDQAEELDRVTSRIHSLINVLRWRGIRPSQIEEFDQLKDAKDGDLIPSESFSALLMAQGARPDQAIWLMPIERLITVIRELVVQREAIKNTIFEISGISDIQRGDTDPNETLGAQQIKAEFGSVRIQRRQREVQRLAKDLIRIKAEIIGEQFSVETLTAITGIQLPTPEQKAAAQAQVQQAQVQGMITGQPAPPPPPEVQELLATPTWPEVKQVMASDALRSFKVDIETDSTIQADLSRAQANMTQFVQGLGAFGEAVGPAVQAGVIPLDIVADLLTGFARNFKLGKQAEDALDRLGKLAEQPQQQDPAADAAAQAEAQKAQAQAQKDGADAQKTQAETQAVQQDQQREDRKLQHDMQMDEREQQREDIKAAVAAFMKEQELVNRTVQ